MFPDGLLGSTLTGLTLLIGACDDFVTEAEAGVGGFSSTLLMFLLTF